MTYYVASSSPNFFLPQTVLKILGPTLDPTLQSGADQVQRGISKGSQALTPGNSGNFPISERVPKLEAFMQCAGEAQYVDDIPKVPGEVYGAFVLAKKAVCEVESVDPSPAMVLVCL